MIPKIIHYCWFGDNKLPASALKCINSWKKFFPGYEIKEWNESNFDINLIKYTQQAAQCKKWAFVSDYARFWVLYKYGGIYFDTDVEVIKSMEDIIARGPFMGFERPGMDGCKNIAPGLGLGAYSHMSIYKEILDYYKNRVFLDENNEINYTTVVEIVSGILNQHSCEQLDQGIIRINEILVYPHDFFCPMDYQTHHIYKTDNTRTIHHYDASWQNKSIKQTIKRLIGPKLTYAIIKYKQRNQK